MADPRMPTADELTLAEDTKPGAGKQLLNLYLGALADERKRKRDLAADRLTEAQHIRRYRYFSVLAGVVLAGATLAVCAYAAREKADLKALSYPLATCTAVAGVFLWQLRLPRSATPPAGPPGA